MTTTPGDEIVYRTTPGGELWHPTGTPQDEATAAASDSIHRQLGAQVEEVRALAGRPQYADNGDGTGTLLLSSTITDNGDGTGTIGA